MIRFLAKAAAFMSLVVCAEVLLCLEFEIAPAGTASEAAIAAGLDWKGVHVQLRLPKPALYVPDPEVFMVQQHLQTHPDMGYTWKHRLGEGQGVFLKWADQEPGLVTTDEAGFINSPFALEARATGRNADIIGVGSSFLQGAAGVFHEFFWAKGLYYYNLATPRHTLPQFNAALTGYAVPAKPAWIIYDLNEASFELIEDFERWRSSGLDWFTYHSGTFCGPTVEETGEMEALKRLEIPNALYHALRKQVGWKNKPSTGTDAATVEKAFGYIAAAHEAARENGIRFVVMLIPSKEKTVTGFSNRWHYLEALLPMLEEAEIPLLDLRKPFADEPDPRALYYQVDGHWNAYGIFKAAIVLADYMARQESD